MEFSVCMCVYDKDNAQYFKEALESILDQTLVPNEIVLVVDGPINLELKNIINQFEEQVLLSDIDFNVIYLPINKGHGEARRVGIENCNHELVAIADADDLNDAERFSRQVEFFSKRSDASVVGGQMLEIEHDTKKPVSEKNVPLSSEDINNYMKSRCPMNQATVMFKKSEVLEAGGYIDFFHNEDYYLWIRMYLNNAKFYNIDRVLVYVRVNKSYFNRRGGLKYFASEYKIQNIMLKNGIISLFRFYFNVILRFMIQVVLTDSIRGYIFKKLFRKKVKNV